MRKIEFKEVNPMYISSGFMYTIGREIKWFSFADVVLTNRGEARVISNTIRYNETFPTLEIARRWTEREFNKFIGNDVEV